MIIDIITLFPNMFQGFLTESIVKRAIGIEAVTINLIDLRSFSIDKHHRVDDTPYGGGAGLVLKCQPVYDCLKILNPKARKLLMTPQGHVFQQADATRLSQEEHLILLCGHYEGFDERIRPLFDEEISVGDFVLTGGEIPAMLISDAIIRLLEGVITTESHEHDSHSNGLLEHPHYTKPQVYAGLSVPEVLSNGNHALIARWRKKESLRNTYKKRPDLLEKYALSKEEQELLKEIITDESYTIVD